MSNRHPSKPAIVLACLLTLILADGAWAAPFTCTGEAYAIQEALAQLSTIDQTTTPFVFTLIGGPAAYPVNNLGFRRSDGLLYAYRGDVGNRQIISIDDGGAGVATMLGSGGLPVPGGLSTPYNSGDVSVDGTEMYFTINGVGTVYTIALPGLTLTRSMPITGGAGLVLDYAAHPSNGLLYGGDRDVGELTELDPVTGIRTNKAITGGPLPIGTSFGGAWFDAEETLYIYLNTGTIYEISGATTPTPTLVSTTVGASSPGNNDGAVCIQVEIGAAKEMSSSNGSLLPSTITIDYVFENFSSGSMTLLSAIDDLAAVFGVHGVDWTFTSVTSAPPAFVNPSFDGHSDIELIDQSGGGESLAMAASATVTVTLTLLTHDGDTDMNDLFCNQIVITGTLGGLIFSDLSTNGSDPDPNGDFIPAEDDPSCFTVPVELMTFSIE